MLGVGDRIKKLRTDLDLTQRELSGPGISYAYISRIERGEREPTVKALRLIADKLNTTPEFLETGQKTVLTLRLGDYTTSLTAVGLTAHKLTHADIRRLSDFTVLAIKRCPTENPLTVAAKMLSEDILMRKGPGEYLLARR